MGLEQIPLSNREFPYKEIEDIYEENEEITEEEKKLLEERKDLIKFYSNLQPFLIDIGEYNPSYKNSAFTLSEKEAEEYYRSLANRKEKKREINLPYIAEKITLGTLHYLLKKEEIQGGLKNRLKLKENEYVDVCFASSEDDWFRGVDGFLVIKDKENQKVKKAIPLQITTSKDEDILKEKYKRITEKGGYLFITNIYAIKELIKKYNQYLDHLDNEIKKDKQQLLEKAKPPWAFFELSDVKEDLIGKEGREIKDQLMAFIKYLEGKI